MGIVLGKRQKEWICAAFLILYDHCFLRKDNFVICHHGCIRKISLAISAGVFDSDLSMQI